MGNRVRFAVGLVATIAACAPVLVAACASPPPVSHIEDKARLDVPIAICRKPLTSGDVSDAGAPRTDTYWSVLFPSFRGFGTPVHPEDVDCVGERPAVEFNGSSGLAPITADDMTVSTTEDGKQVVWLRLVHPSDGPAAGVLALERPRTSEIDVYAIGRYKGSLQHSRFDVTQLGTTRLVVAHDEGCADVKVDVECDSTLDFYIGTGGKLLLAGDSPQERLRYGNVKGLGRVKYRLTTAPPVVDGRSVRVHEKLQVRDANDEDIRKAEGDRILVLGPDGKLVAQQDSLWSQVPKN